jgi:L-ascorbate oxidase
LVVREANDPNSKYYDVDSKDHVIVLNDWLNTPIAQKFNAFLHDEGDEAIDAILINGRGGDKNEDNNEDEHLPRAEFVVEKGKRYRFRMINAGILFCPLQVSIEHHNLTIIATDGNPIEPIEVVSFFILAGIINRFKS